MVALLHGTTSKTVDPLSQVRANALTEANVNAYFALLEKTLTDSGVLNKPASIYNMDESGMPLDAKQLKRVAKRGVKKVHGRSSGDKSQITLVACGNAAASVLPPMLIFKGERLNHEWTVGEVPNTLYGMSENWWIDQELFFYWLKHLFLKHIPPQRPVMLVMDGHSSHYTPEALRGAAEQGVIIFCIPPNTTHATQPLDVSLFGPLKRHWSAVCHKYLTKNPGSTITKLQFNSLFSQAWYKAIQPETIVSGFRKTGICPLDKTAVKISQPSTVTTEDESSSSDSESEGETSVDRTSDKASNDVTGNTDEELSEGNTIPNPVFTEEQITLFERRLENGYDLYVDPDYVAWLRLNHSSHLPSDLVQDCSMKQQIMTPQAATALADVKKRSSLVLPQEQEIVTPQAATTLADGKEQVSSREQQIGKEPSFLVPSTEQQVTSPQAATPQGNGEQLPSSVSSSSPTSSTPSRRLSLISEFLTPPNVSSKKGKGKGKAPGGARVLTSDDSLALLQEKAKQKREEEEAKLQRKREREEKRVAKKTEKAEKKEERERKLAERQRELQQKEKNSKAAPRARARSERGLQSREITSNECCACFGGYEDDLENGELMREWVQCTNNECQKWMHEDCVKESDCSVCAVCKSVFR